MADPELSGRITFLTPNLQFSPAMARFVKLFDKLPSILYCFSSKTFFNSGSALPRIFYLFIYALTYEAESTQHPFVDVDVYAG